MSATAATKKQKPLKRHPSKLKQMSAYMILTIILISIVAVLFAFPLYWIITGSFKTGAAINATTPEWWPSQWVLTNYQKLFSGKSAPLWQLAVPFGSKFSADGEPIYFSVGPTVPAAIRWMVNTVFMAVMSMILTCITAAMAGYALAKKRFVGRKLLFTLIVCAMALPKQVILIPLLREMSALNLYNTIWAVIFPIVGWPFGVFLMKQFSEGIPTEMLEAARIDGASEARTFVKIVLPMVKPGIGALAIFTFINSWNDYFMQLIMLSSTSNLTISLGIAKLQAENSTDFGLIMAGAARPLCPSSSSSSFSRSTSPRASQWVLLKAKISTAACGRNREKFLAQRSARRKTRPRVEADAGHRKRALILLPGPQAYGAYWTGSRFKCSTKRRSVYTTERRILTHERYHQIPGCHSRLLRLL